MMSYDIMSIAKPVLLVNLGKTLDPQIDSTFLGMAGLLTTFHIRGWWFIPCGYGRFGFLFGKGLMFGTSMCWI